MCFDDLDMKILKENFDDEMLNELDIDNASKIIEYLEENGFFYAKDLLLTFLDLFLLPVDDFIEKFEQLKNDLGEDFDEQIGEDMSLMENFYEE